MVRNREIEGEGKKERERKGGIEDRLGDVGCICDDDDDDDDERQGAARILRF